MRKAVNLTGYSMTITFNDLYPNLFRYLLWNGKVFNPLLMSFTYCFHNWVIFIMYNSMDGVTSACGNDSV